jgi:glucokinase
MVPSVEQNYIGIDIGGTNLRFALVGAGGNILCRSRAASFIAEGRESFCSRLISGIEEMHSYAKQRGLLLSAIGAGVPGLVDSAGIVCSSVNMRPLDGFGLASYIEKSTGLPAICGNDANVIGMGEFVYGAGADFRTMAVISIGTGLGSALILDGQLWTGASGFASEFGHLTVNPGGLPCPCGNCGCLEQYVSASAVIRYAAEHGLMHDSDGQRYEASTLAELARSGNIAAIKAFQVCGTWLGIALASLANILNPQAIIIGGGVGVSLDLIKPSLENELEQRCFREISAGLKVLPGMLGDDAGLLGAAGLARACFATR